MFISPREKTEKAEIKWLIRQGWRRKDAKKLTEAARMFADAANRRIM